MLRTTLLALALAAAAPVQAVPIRYTIEGIGSGWYFFGWTFTETPYRFVITADTDSWDGHKLTVDLFLVHVGDGEHDAVFNQGYALRYEAGRVSIEGAEFGEDQMSFDAAVPDFLDGFAPVAGTDIALSFWTQNTNRGLFQLNNTSEVQFSAALVPEPATWAMWAAGLAAAYRATRRPSRATPRTPR